LRQQPFIKVGINIRCAERRILCKMGETAGETVIELTEEKKGIKEIYDSDKKMYV
jgi:hypothetical protein